MARLLDALRPDATLVLVGDPFQLVSVEAGRRARRDRRYEGMRRTDGPLAPDVVLLERIHRFGADSAIAALAMPSEPAMRSRARSAPRQPDGRADLG